jgi:hypothetical protein
MEPSRNTEIQIVNTEIQIVIALVVMLTVLALVLFPQVRAGLVPLGKRRTTDA